MNTATTGIDTRDMLLIHRVIRREVGGLPGLFRATRDRARAARVAAHASEMLDFLHAHHTGEDELLWPVPPPARLAFSLVGWRQLARETAAIHGGPARAA